MTSVILAPLFGFFVGLYIVHLRREIERLKRSIEYYSVHELKPPPEGTTQSWFAGAEMRCFVITEDKVILRVEDKFCTAQDIYSTARWLDGIYCEMRGIEPNQHPMFKKRNPHEVEL